LQNLHQLFDWQYIGQIIGGDISKFCGLLRVYDLYTQPLILEGQENRPPEAVIIASILTMRIQKGL
jgi:hypothetical protein